MRSLVAPPQRLGRYEILRPIAQGGMATVYLARTSGIGGFERLVAIKCCHPHLAADAEFAAMFLDEARLAARIHDPHVVATLDVGEDGGLFFAMEYVEGPSLAEWVKTAGAIDAGVAVRIMLDALAGLEAAHQLCADDGAPMNLVHRDVSPQNILVGGDGRARLVDFGVAKAEARLSVTRAGQVKGKFGYMPPEQFLAQAVDKRADVYAAGVVLWEALAGRRLYEADSDAAIMNLVLRGDVPALPAAAGKPLEKAIRKALAKRPEDRYASAAAFASAIEEAGVAAASHADVARTVRHACASWFSARQLFVAHARTHATVGVQPMPTLVRRLLAGRVWIVPRGVAVGGALFIALGAGGLFLARAGHDTHAEATTSVPTPLRDQAIDRATRVPTIAQVATTTPVATTARAPIEPTAIAAVSTPRAAAAETVSHAPSNHGHLAKRGARERTERPKPVERTRPARSSHAASTRPAPLAPGEYHPNDL